MIDYTGTGRKDEVKNPEYEEYLASYHGHIAPLSYEKWKMIKQAYLDPDQPTMTNLRCINPKCNISLSPTQSQWENLNYHCPECQTPQHGLWYNCGHVHKDIKNALECEKGNWPAPTPQRPAQPAVPATSTSPNPKDQIGITKLRLDLIPPPALARLSKVMELGAKKYGAYNWRETNVNLTVYLAAGLRHTYSILDGEDIDLESGQHHAAHVAACMFIILDALELGKLIDDRPTPGNFAHLVTKLQEKK